ncbi:L-threonine 3-dehydrogenase [Dothidotthia symphoricarpi CBS 119687]|uniref:L-threonine 3-dehydrogenase n=1 Tax=Dothidotthia symphoricarpi CBS 119687 TaxID=1392245 RepID=A0A6A6A270_9PLEO|nr:L-threonine 3-dehydrogenase [Dothidotthia symphoricarpi CBS 119687]KAF2125295.1 L-threonine 3-dehydrogenase [Dothidotthia symphoricarpi CBS 119687]
MTKITTENGSQNMGVPKEMKALQYSGPEKFAVVTISVPEIGDDDVLVKISACGVCGTDLHYHKGEFLAKWPLIPGHEAAGTIAAVGKNVMNLTIGERVAADPMQPCLNCFHCNKRKPLLCESMTAFGGNVPGGFAEYCRYPARQVHPIGDLPDLEAVLVEPAACAAHGIERMQIDVGSRVLLFGCGPTGILLAQLIRMNGAAHLTIASQDGPKLDLAKQLNVADSFVTISNKHDQAHSEMEALEASNPYGFDIVVEATGAPTVLEQAIQYVRKGGKLVVYGVYDKHVKIAWSPFRIWEYEITVLASFCSMQHMPAVLEYVNAGKLKLGGIANKTYRIDQWEECLEAVRKQEVVKAAIVFE